jgi:hypothetical protein
MLLSDLFGAFPQPCEAVKLFHSTASISDQCKALCMLKDSVSKVAEGMIDFELQYILNMFIMFPLENESIADEFHQSGATSVLVELLKCGVKSSDMDKVRNYLQVIMRAFFMKYMFSLGSSLQCAACDWKCGVLFHRCKVSEPHEQSTSHRRSRQAVGHQNSSF